MGYLYLFHAVGAQGADATASCCYELEHLATFNMSAKRGVVKAAVALQRLWDLASTTGVWTMRVMVRVERQYVTVLDVDTNKVQHTRRARRNITSCMRQLCVNYTRTSLCSASYVSCTHDTARVCC